MKSHVTVEQQKCLVCAKDFDTGSILLDMRLRERFEHTTLTGWGLCPEHQKLYEDGYIALVGADETKSSKTPGGNVTPEGAYRTGEIAHLKFEAFDRIVNVSGRGSDGKRYPMMFCDPEVIKLLAAKVPKEVTPT